MTIIPKGKQNLPLSSLDGQCLVWSHFKCKIPPNETLFALFEDEIPLLISRLFIFSKGFHYKIRGFYRGFARLEISILVGSS